MRDDVPADGTHFGEMSVDNKWHLRKGPGQVFGPVSMDSLRAWASDGRVGPEDELSAGDGAWRPARDMPELGMEWLLEMPDGGLYGPVPLAAFLDMLRDGTLAPEFRVRRMDEPMFRRLGDLAAGPSGMAVAATPAPAVISAPPPEPAPVLQSDATAAPAAEPKSTPPTAGRINPPDEARMLNELRDALGVGRRFSVLGRLRPDRAD